MGGGRERERGMEGERKRQLERIRERDSNWGSHQLTRKLTAPCMCDIVSI